MVHRGRVLTLKRNFAWSFVGNAIFNLAQWLLLVALARLGSASLVGEFALSLAITAPIFLSVGLNLRVVQATDVTRQWRLADYMTLRHLLNVVSCLLSVVVGLALGMRGAALLVLVVIAAAKAVEAVSQTYYGYFQFRERMDLVARSLLLRSALGSSAFVVLFWASDSLVYAAVGLWAGWTVTLLALDRPCARRLWSRDPGRISTPRRAIDWNSLRQLARRAFPLGVDAGLSSLTLNIPRYLVQILEGAARLGVFAALAYFSQVISMVTGAMGETVVPRLAVYYEGRQRRPYIQLLSKLTLFGVAVTGAGIMFALVLGEWFLRLVLGPQYVDVPLLVLLMGSAGLTTIQRSLGRGLQAAHRFSAYLVVDVVTVVTVAAAAAFLIDRYGLLGAGWSLCLGFAAGIAADFWFLRGVLRELDVVESAPRRHQFRHDTHRGGRR